MRARHRKLTIALVLLLCTLVSALAPMTAAAADPISYVSLGDSIATGTVDYWSSITPYVSYFYDYLVGKYPGAAVSLTRLAHDGDRSNDLLTKLNTDGAFQTALKGADVVTISMGGNNLMQAAAIPGFTDIDWAHAEQGTQDFEAQWATIMEIIRGWNPTAKIIVLTVYNPYNQTPGFWYSEDKGLFAAAEPYLGRINGVIEGEAARFGYAVADAHQAFLAYQPSSMGSVTYMYPAWYQYLYRNPHPKALGQTILTNLHKQAYESMVEPPVTYTVSTSADPSGAGETAGGGTFEDGTQVTVTATANAGYEFVEWTEGAAQVSTSASYTFVVTADRTLIAHFSEILPVDHTASVSKIAYAKAGQNLNVTITVVDEANAPVVGAIVTATLYRNGVLATQFTVTTSSTGTATYRYAKAPSGTYTTVINNVTAAGYVWDGATPDDNSYLKK